MLTPIIALLLRSSDTHAYVASGLDRNWTIRVCRSLPELLDAVATPGLSLVVMEAIDEQRRSNSTAIAAVRSADERIPILVVCALTGGQSHLIADVVRAGATELLLRGVDDSRHAIRTAIRQARQRSAAQRIFDELLPLLPVPAVALLRYAICRATDEPSVAQAAREIQVDRKTLFNWFRCTRVSPGEFLNWVRLSLAVGALESTAHTAERVALDMGFASGTAFRNMLQRYTGRTSGELRVPGSLDSMLEHLKERLVSSAEPVAPPIHLPAQPGERRRA